MPHSRNEAGAPEECADAEAFAAENASLRDRQGHHSPETVEDGALLKGVRATERTLMHALERFGVRKIEALGAPFDPALHEAVMEVDDGSYPPGSVARVLEDGYMIHDRLLRAARVAVAKRRSNESHLPDEATPAAPSQSRSSRHTN
jgi:hypothetical protein